MEIEYLQKYKDNIDILNRNKNRSPVEPATMEEIQALEAELNNGAPFPKAIREFLYLGGNYTGLSGIYSISYMKDLEPVLIKISNITQKGGILFLMLKQSYSSTEIDNDLVSFRYLQSEVENKLKLANFTIDDIRNIAITKKQKYFLIIARK